MKVTLPAMPPRVDVDRSEHGRDVISFIVFGISAAYLLLLAAMMVCSVRWDTVTTISASGVLIEPEAAADVVALSGGRVERVLVRPGDRIRAGEAVALLAEPALDAELARLAERQSRLRAELGLITVLASDRLDGVQRLGPTRDLLSCRPPVATTASAAGDEAADLRTRLSAITRDIAWVQSERKRRGEILALAPGVVTAALVSPGHLILRGQALLRMAPGRVSGPLVARLYVRPADGARVRPGMEVRVDPQLGAGTGAGFIEGVVEAVAPASPQAEGSVQVMVRLCTDLHAPSGYRWSGGRGAAGPLVPMTAQARIVTARPLFLCFGLPAVTGVFDRFVMWRQARSASAA